VEVVRRGTPLTTTPGRESEIKESADKPGSVMDDHSSGTPVAGRLLRPTRKRPRAVDRHSARRGTLFPYLVLLREGFTLPPLLPVARCALTAPFHPYQPRLAVYFLWHFPSARAAQTLSGSLPCGARTFLRCLRTSDRLADSTGKFNTSGLSELEGTLIGRIPLNARQFRRQPCRLFQRQLVQQHPKTTIKVLAAVR